MGYGPADDTTSALLLHKALDVGYRMLDTASMYGMGHNETLIGQAIKKRRHEYVLASKCGIIKTNEGKTEINGTPEMVRKTCEESLRRLQTDVIDLYYYHRLDKRIPVEETVGALSDLVDAGKVRFIGLSEMSTETLCRAHAVHPIAAMQSEYSLWSRTPERGMLETCRKLGTSLVAFSPLARAFLAGAAKDVTQLLDDDIRCTNARPRFEVDAFAENAKLLVPYAEIARKNSCSMAQLALAWLLAQGDHIIPIPGTKHIEYMLENVAAGDLELDKSTLNDLDNLINETTVIGRRYTDAIMASTDAERD